MTASSVLASCHKRPIRGIFALVCPGAASGHATAPPSTPRNARRFMSNPRLRRRHRVVMTKTSTLEGGWNGPRVQVIAPHDQCLRWVKIRSPGAQPGGPLCPHERTSSGEPVRSEKCRQQRKSRLVQAYVASLTFADSSIILDIWTRVPLSQPLALSRMGPA
jgi:hypothetical protein